MKTQVGDYVDGTCPQGAAKFVKGKIKNFTNINFKKLSGFLDEFDTDWKSQFEVDVIDNVKDSLNTIIANRNNIAHGTPDNITMRSIKGHYENLKLIILVLDGIIIR